MLLRRGTKGFTLVEMMVTVLIIAVLLAIALPNFLTARETSRAKTCQENLRMIDTAKEHWAMENQMARTDTPTAANLVTEYMRARYEDMLPPCPSGGKYDIGNIETPPTCDIGTNQAGDADDHILEYSR